MQRRGSGASVTAAGCRRSRRSRSGRTWSRRGLLPLMPSFVSKAQEIGAALAGVDSIEVVPDPSQVAMLHVFVRAELDRVRDALLDIAEERKTLIAGPVLPDAATERAVRRAGDRSVDTGCADGRDRRALRRAPQPRPGGVSRVNSGCRGPRIPSSRHSRLRCRISAARPRPCDVGELGHRRRRSRTAPGG